MLTIFLPVGIYTAGYLFTFFRIAGQFAWHWAANNSDRKYRYWQNVKEPNGEQWFCSILLAFFAAPVWPLSLPVAIGLANVKDVSKRSLFYMPKDRRVEMQAARIRELEQAAGI